jgi:hypothetical protein
MKEFFNKHKKIIIIVLIILFLLGVSTAVYFIFFNEKSEPEQWQDLETTQEFTDEPMPEPTFDLKTSSEAIEATYELAQNWSSDAKLFECSAVPTSITYPNVTYEYIGFEDGKFANWFCTYYSASKRENKMYEYKEGNVDDSIEAADVGEYGYILYADINYPEPSSVVDSVDIYTDALDQGLDDEANYVNMYLWDTSNYGFVWEIEERSRTEKDEYEIGILENTYIYDIFSGELEKKF